jgi:REP element-mobilizing transposase RayT
VLLEAAQFYHEAGKWFVFTMVLMPDHLHALISVPDCSKLTEMWAGWKRFTARRAKIEWQRGCFEHRLRGDEGWAQKSEYIRQNPVRADLVTDADAWPYVIGWNDRDGLENRPPGEWTPWKCVPSVPGMGMNKSEKK